MKKSLLAVAAIGAFASAAQAQSSVTVYGILDVGYIGTNERVPAVGATTITGSAATPAYKRTSNVLGQSAESTSRLGFKGTEDLGGGTSAFFTVEMQLFPADANLEGGTVANTNTGTSANTIGGLINRQSFVGLKKNGIGQAAIGTQYTPAFNSGAKITAGQYANVVGSVLYAANGSGTTSAGFTNRLNNSLTVATDSFAGFKLNGIYQANNNSRTQNGVSTNATSGGSTNISAWGVGADYQWNKLLVTGAYQSVQNDSPGDEVRLAATSYVPTNGYNVRSNESIVGATYDFGILKAYAGWGTRTVISTNNNSNYIKRSGQEIGVRSYITPTIEAWASAGTGRYRGYGTSEPTANFIAYQLGTNYYLSKRTNLYGIFGSNQSSNTSSSTAFPTGAASGINQYAVGVRHTF